MHRCDFFLKFCLNVNLNILTFLRVTMFDKFKLYFQFHQEAFYQIIKKMYLKEESLNSFLIPEIRKSRTAGAAALGSSFPFLTELPSKVRVGSAPVIEVYTIS